MAGYEHNIKWDPDSYGENESKSLEAYLVLSSAISQPIDFLPVAFDASDGPTSDSEGELEKSMLARK
ncbi:unnamed protein product [Prunus armeniaca]|uniref:Uncharacterized protein n=1 Tax=Prunus armeniaca TaxID=36596 RepID=A0A6J5XXQ7_PRUAR|nr:unnamed protein product [Prunus armeniaca]